MVCVKTWVASIMCECECMVVVVVEEGGWGYGYLQVRGGGNAQNFFAELFFVGGRTGRSPSSLRVVASVPAGLVLVLLVVVVALGGCT